MLKTRKLARQEGHSRYYTGVMCIHGHDSARYVSTGGCIECTLIYAKLKAAKEKERLRKWREKTNRGLKTLEITIPENAVDVAIEWANSCLIAAGKPALNRKDS